MISISIEKIVLCGLLFAVTGCSGLSPGSARNVQGVRITVLEDRANVEINGKLFTEYHFKNAAKPYCYPLIGPTGAGMTRNWPMKETPGEEHDHLHHQGLWFGHQIVNGKNFWSAGPTLCKVLQETLTTATTGKESASITTQNKWLNTNGTVVLRDERTLTFYNRADERIMDFEITLKATDDDVTFGDDKDGILGIRVAETMRVLKPVPKGEKPKPGDGHIVLSTGASDDGQSAAAAKEAKREATTWGKRADWCDYYGPVDGKTVGVAIFDHPSNLRHPTWWHVRDYGLFAANPFGQHHFENLPDRQAGNFTLPKGQSQTFRYRIYLHEGDEKQGKVAERYKEFVQSSDKPVK